ncbi:MAG: hypothetical protein COB04_04270 [Gammaproteobacteria bacterium]|nr:MAG: hypothetical protein COB04_04270 [Gammaproteobacteria bacterium]
MKKIALAVGLCCLSATLAASEKPYLNVGASFTQYDSDGLPDAADMESFRVKAGSHFSPHLGLEVHLLLGTSGSSVTSSSVKWDVDTDVVYSFLARAQYPVSIVNLYALGGVSFGEFTATSNNALFSSQSGRESGLSYGVGGDIKVYNNVYLNMDYMVYFSDDNFNFSGISTGVRVLLDL